MISNKGCFVIVLTLLTHVNCQPDLSCSKAEIYINNHFFPSAHLSIQRTRGPTSVLSVSLDQETEHLLSQQHYKVLPSTGHSERHRCVVRKASLGPWEQRWKNLKEPCVWEKGQGPFFVLWLWFCHYLPFYIVSKLGAWVMWGLAVTSTFQKQSSMELRVQT